MRPRPRLSPAMAHGYGGDRLHDGATAPTGRAMNPRPTDANGAPSMGRPVYFAEADARSYFCGTMMYVAMWRKIGVMS